MVDHQQPKIIHLWNMSNLDPLLTYAWLNFPLFLRKSRKWKAQNQPSYRSVCLTGVTQACISLSVNLIIYISHIIAMICTYCLLLPWECRLVQSHYWKTWKMLDEYHHPLVPGQRTEAKWSPRKDHRSDPCNPLDKWNPEKDLWSRMIHACKSNKQGGQKSNP